MCPSSGFSGDLDDDNVITIELISSLRRVLSDNV